MKEKISILILFLMTSCSSVVQFVSGVDITFDPRTIKKYRIRWKL